MSDSNDDEKVGPGRPPCKYRFVKGKSGNPRGRPRGSLNRETFRRLYYEELFDRTLPVNGRGGRENISVVRALLRTWIHTGLDKDAVVIEKIIASAVRIAADAPESQTTVDRAQDDAAILRRFTEALNRRGRGDQEREIQDPPDADEAGGDDD